MWSTLFRFGIPPFLYLGFNTSVVKVCQYHECMVLGISPAQTRSGLLLGLPLLFLICMSSRSGMSFLLSCSFPGPRAVAIGNDLGVTATCILLPLVFL
jgi:hypothetical protein